MKARSPEVTAATLRHGTAGTVWCYRSDLADRFSPHWFDAAALRRAGQIVGTARAGRAPALFLQIGTLRLVLRQYRRGGLVRRLLTDRYLYLGRGRTRAFREFDLLGEMWHSGLPVPAPVAARVCRQGLYYRASLLMERLPGESLASRLGQPLADDRWRRVGRCLRRFHDAGIWHADLNAHNILLDESAGDDGCYLIDFDRARRRDPDDSRWRQRNLQRLWRSIDKLWPAVAHDGVAGQAVTGWQALLAGYAEDSPVASRQRR